MTIFPDKHEFAFLFPGIGVKPFGREYQFYRRYRTIIEPFLLKASAVAGVDLGASLLAGTIFDNEQFVREIFAFAFSHGTYLVFAEKGLYPRLMAGHSLGIYAALSSSGAISFDDGLIMIKKAHQFGRRCSGKKKFGVAVIIGIGHDEILNWSQQSGYGSIHLANLNSSSSAVFVGYAGEIEALLHWAEAEGALKSIRLRIDIPYHSPLFMEQATKDLKKEIAKMTWRKPRCPILSALDNTLLHRRDELIEMTATNLSHPINWPGLIKTLELMGIDEVVECGAGISLTQHGRFIEGAPRHYNLKNMRRRLDY